MRISQGEVLTVQEQPVETAIHIGIASTAEEKREIYRFRYSVYVEDMSRKLASVDHVNKLIYDELDEWAVLLYAKAGTKLIGTARVNIGSLTEFPSGLAQVLFMDKFQKFNGRKKERFAFNSKLMIAQAYRNSPILYLLMVKGYELYCSNQVQFSFGGCNFYSIRLYEQMGGRRYGKNFYVPDYGLMVPLVTLVEDIEHLRAVRSPFFRLARKRGAVDNRLIANWFLSMFPNDSNVTNSQLINEENFWNILSNCLGNVPHEVVPVLQGLSEIEARKFLHYCGVLVQCQAGEHIITCGDTSNDLNILLTGRLESVRLGLAKEIILPGQNFGASGLIGQLKHTVDVTAITTANILEVSRFSFPKFLHQYPNIARKVLQNLSSIENNHKITGGEHHEEKDGIAYC